MGRSTLAGVHHDEKFHEVVVYRLRGRLDNEDIPTANAFADHDLRLAVVEVSDECITELYADVIRDVLCQLRVGVACQDTQISSV